MVSRFEPEEAAEHKVLLSTRAAEFEDISWVGETGDAAVQVAHSALHVTHRLMMA